MAIQISGNTVINNQAEIATGMQSLYDRVFSIGVSTALQNRDFCSVTGSGTTITLPSSPVSGNQVTIKVGNFTNTTIGRNGSNIMSLGEDMIIDSQYSTVDLIYVNSTQGWEIT